MCIDESGDAVLSLPYPAFTRGLHGFIRGVTLEYGADDWLGEHDSGIFPNGSVI